MLLSVTDLEAGYGQLRVLRGVSVRVGDGERIGVFGPNGHGKTTLLRAISGLLKPRRGEIRFKGEVISGLPPWQIVERGVIHVPQGNILFPRMTVLENLTLAAYTKRAAAKKAANLERVFDLFPRLNERREQLCRTLSGGERQMLALAAGIMGEGQLLLLDEPSLGLAPKLKLEVRRAISRIAQSGVSLLLVEQDVDFVLALTDRLYLLRDGSIMFEGNRDQMLKDVQLQQMYFGKIDDMRLNRARESSRT